MAKSRVLIVDDEENQRTGLAAMVQSWGYSAETAKDGQDALRFLFLHKDVVGFKTPRPELREGEDPILPWAGGRGSDSVGRHVVCGRTALQSD